MDLIYCVDQEKQGLSTSTNCGISNIWVGYNPYIPQLFTAMLKELDRQET